MRQTQFLARWLVLSLTLCCVVAQPNADETTSKTSATTSSSDESRKTSSRTYDFDINNTDWGMYHDPQGVFCGKYDCYKILGFDYENFGSPDQKIITQHYRSLSRHWHPDKSKHPEAKERFVKIARAYEVLSNRDVRKDYDDLRYDPQKYYMKHGASVLWNYAPQSDTAVVVIALLLLANVFSWYAQKHRWQQVADRLVKAALEDWVPSQGGTSESKELREHAMSILEERERAASEETDVNGTGVDATLSKTTASAKKQTKKSKEKLTGKEKKQKEMEALKPIIVEIVSEMKDFGGGYHLPTWRDLLIISLLKLPFRLSKSLAWMSMYYMRRLRGVPLSDDEKQVLTERAVGPVIWETSSDEQRTALVKRELWIVANLAEWSEEQDFEKLSNGEKKLIKKMKKKGIRNTDGDINDILKED
jgi:DnaJ family protein C protein 25